MELAEINRYFERWPKPLPKEQQQALFVRKSQGDMEARSLLIVSNYRLVLFVARKYSANHITIEDFIDVGQIGLIKAVDYFDYSRGKSFSTYASLLIENEIRMFLRSNKHDADFHAEYLDGPMYQANGDTYTLSDILESQDGMANMEWLDELSDKTRLYDALFCLSELEQKILKYRFGLVDGKFYKNYEIASILGGVHRTIVSREKMRALKKLEIIINNNYVYKKGNNKRFNIYAKNKLVSIIYEAYFNNANNLPIEEKLKEMNVDVIYFKQLLSQSQTISLKRFEKNDIKRYREMINHSYYNLSYEQLIKKTIPLILYIIAKCKKKGIRSIGLLGISCNAYKEALAHLSKIKTPYYCDFFEDKILGVLRSKLPYGERISIINGIPNKRTVIGKVKLSGRMRKVKGDVAPKIKEVSSIEGFFTHFPNFSNEDVLRKLEKMPPRGRDIVKEYFGIGQEAVQCSEIIAKYEITKKELFSIIKFICDSILQELNKDKALRDERENENKAFAIRMPLDEFLSKLNPLEKKLVELYKFYHNDTKKISQSLGIDEVNIIAMLNALANAAETITKGKIVDDKVFAKTKERSKCLKK